MLKIDAAILSTNDVICKNIKCFDASERGLLSQDILAHLRNFVEYIAEKVSANGKDVDPHDYQENVNALKYLKSCGNLRFLSTFHSLLQKSVSHYTLDENSSERLMLKYYEYLLKIKTFLKTTYNLEVLQNINDFPLNIDTELADYYKKIAEKIHSPSENCEDNPYNDRYYIRKVKPFFVKQHIYYEVTFTTANNRASKFDRVIAFTKLDLLENYAVKLSIHNDIIQVLGKTMSVQIIDDWSVSIRPCELNNFADIFGIHLKLTSGNIEYRKLMKFLTETKMNLTELINAPEKYYQSVKLKITKRKHITSFFDVLDQCRKLVLNNMPGCNVIRYLLYKMDNKIIKAQYGNDSCDKLSKLFLSYGCIPFDQMPYNSSLKNHNPRLYDLFECISPDDHEHELFARFIRNNTEVEGTLFTKQCDIVNFDNIDNLIQRYNSALYFKHQHRKLEIFKKHVYIKGYVDDCIFIIQKLIKLSTKGIVQYTNSVDSWLQESAYPIDCAEKKEALRKMFSASHVALIYGSAGTGKSTLISHISHFFADYKKIYLANTNPAVDNMHRKVKVEHSEYKTIASFLLEQNNNVKCDLLFIDECSTVNNSDMRKVLEKTTFKLLILVGDIFQIESILFGNWFNIARSFIHRTSVFELTIPYRSKNDDLKAVWNGVRNLDNNILEMLVKNSYSSKLDKSLFDHTTEDQIILCLNYDGLYGINNINRFLQNSNLNKSITWGINIYKIGDPILFNESNRFTPLIYNNMKGRIVNINVEEMKIWFEIELDISINEFDASEYDFNLMKPADNGNSIIRFSVNKYKSTDEDNDSSDVIVPFQIAYAVSIHKAQGLEYNSVKIVITHEAGEQITHNIFYTAITRAKQYLKIYWSPETEKKVLENMVLHNNDKDIALLKAKFNC